MKKLLLLLLASVSFSVAQSMSVGGYVPLISNISCQTGNVFPGYADSEGLLATCILNSNSPEYSVDFVAESDSAISLFTIVGSDGEGKLGKGLVDLEVRYSEDRDSYNFTWSPGRQMTATSAYVIRIYGYLKKNSNFRLVTSIHNDY